MPPAVVTVTSTAPAPAGEVATRVVALVTVTEVAAGVVPKSTVGAGGEAGPVTVTTVPPASGPALGVMAVTAGTVVVGEQVGGRGGAGAARRW